MAAAGVALLLSLVLGACSEAGDRVDDPSTPVAETPACDFQPSPENTGAGGDLPFSPVTSLGDGESLEDATVASLDISGSNVTVRNVKVEGAVFVTGDHVALDRVSTNGIAISSATDVRVERSHISQSPGDGFHVTSDGPDMVRDIVLSHNLVREPRVPDDAHYDGTQVRGVRGLLIECSVYDAGAYEYMYNAAIYIEDANGGATGVRLEHNWLIGSAWSLMIGTPGTSLTGNRVSGDIKWGTCYLGDFVGSGPPRERDNVLAETGEVIDLCPESAGQTSGLPSPGQPQTR